jgi:CheY-like chemotaxis protein
MQILYVEDNSNDAALVERFINTTPHSVVVVSSVDEARAALSQSFDLILIDVLIEQKRAGYALAKEIRDQGVNIPLVAVTALSGMQDRASCQQAGFNEVLNKPFQITELAVIIQNYCN